MLTPAIGMETITLFVRSCLSSITLASVLLTPRGRQPDLQMDPSYDLFLQLDVPFSVLREIVGLWVFADVQFSEQSIDHIEYQGEKVDETKLMSSVIVEETAIIVLILTAPIRESLVRTLRTAEERTMRPSYPQSTSTSNMKTLTMISERTMKGVIERGSDVEEVSRNGTLRMLTARKDRLNRRLERLGMEDVLVDGVLDDVVLDDEGVVGEGVADNGIADNVVGEGVADNAVGEGVADNAVGEGVADNGVVADNVADNGVADANAADNTPDNAIVADNAADNATDNADTITDTITTSKDTDIEEDAPEELPVERKPLPKDSPVPKKTTPLEMKAVQKQEVTPKLNATPQKPAPQPPLPMKSLEAISEGEEEPIETNIPGLPDGMALQPVSEKEATATLKKGHVRDTLKRIVEQYGTMRGETLQAGVLVQLAESTSLLSIPSYTTTHYFFTHHVSTVTS